MAINDGVNISKINSYAVLQIEHGINLTKINSYAVLALNHGVNLSKVNSYAVYQNINLAAPIWLSFAFHDGILSNNYRQDVDLSPAAGPITFSVIAGALPDGLSLYEPSPGTVVELIGTPIVAGIYTFTLRALNAYGSADKQFVITVSDPIAVQGSGQASFF